MKTLMCSLAAILSVALSSAVFAAVDDVNQIVTGTVVSVKGISIEIDTHDGRGRFEVNFIGDLPTPKVGEKVRVHYYHCGGSHKFDLHCADKFEKVGNAEGGSKKR
jgi:hypothetical protein